MKPQEPIAHNYSIATLNKIFAISSLVLLAVTGGMVAYDYIRGWKHFQIEFMRLERERITQQLQLAEKSENQAELARIDKESQQRELDIAKQRDAYRAAQEDLKSWEGKHYAADQNYRFAKATLDAQRYDAEIAIQQKASDAREKEARYQAQAQHVEDLKVELERVTHDRDASKARLDVWDKKIADLEDQKKQATEATVRLNKQLQSVEPNTAFFILNAPLLDFISPTLKIDQIVVNDMYVDLNYLRVPRVDRCTTCHRAIDQTGFESKKEGARLEAELQKKLDNFEIPADKVADIKARIDALERAKSLPGVPNPFRTHPFLDTFVGSASPHPMGEFGCTSCHRGQDRATEFARAGHTPQSSRQEHRWERQWDWEAQEFLEEPMYPRQYFEASCLKCHSDQIKIDKGPAVTRGTALVELYGCYACHKIDNWRFANLRKPGPELNGIAEKTTPDWAIRWISDPHNFRSTTRMPSFFYQRNMVGPAVPAVERDQNMKMQNAEIQAIVAFLFSRSSHRTWQAPPAGDVNRGKTLVANVGCMGCHLNQDSIKDESGAVRLARRDDFPIERNYGFNLVGVGTKTNAAWLYNWLKNPKGYYESAPMPDLRLTDQEAADITAYLMTLQKPGFIKQPLPTLDPKVVADLSKGYLINTMSEDEADAKLKAMPLHDQLVYLGQRSVEKYGCYSCHNIKGFETQKPIGTDLTIEGSKALHLFDFGAVHEYHAEDAKDEHIIHTVPSWVYNKLRSPRVYDDHREKNYNDKLKMPNFHMTPAEAESISLVVLGLTKDKVTSNRLAEQDPRSRAIQEGRKLISQHNCRACHIVEGDGRAIATVISDPMMLPPDLTPEGGRVQSPWLFNFLKDPTVMKMRPWLSVRMPTFHFADDEANTIVQSFAADGRVLQFDQARFQDPPSKNVEIGKVAFEMLRCAQCHPTVPGAVAASPTAGSLAPNLSLARVRLQHDWIADWIRRPNEMIPGTRMPTNFPRDSVTGDFTSPLIMAIDTPPFAAYKARLLPLFGSEDAIRKGLKDVPAITGYLRDYIWSLGPSEMRLAQPAVSPPQPPVPAPPAQQGKIEPALKSPRSQAQTGRASR